MGNANPGSTRGFGKVLGSIQGLQQRLDDFSLQEVTEAETKARTLIGKLKALQAHLALLESLDTAITDTNRIVGEIPQLNFDLVAPDNFDNHPQLRAIVQAGKLIRMHRLIQAARSSAASVSFDFDTVSQPNASGPDHGVANAAVAAHSVQAKANAEISKPERAPEISRVNNTIVTGNVMMAPDLTSKNPTPSAPVANVSRAVAPTAASYEFNDFKLDDLTESAPSSEIFVFPENLLPPERPAEAKKDKIAPNKSHFDERLLNDLIDTYGEFVVPSKPAKSSEATPELKSSIPVKTDSLIQLPAGPSTALVPANDGVSEAPLALPSPESEGDRATTVKTHGLIIKNRVEIDRQLKSIIKDYGEYDLYSRSKPSNFNKTAAIIAFVVLALVLGGFYFFKRPPQTAPVAGESLAPESATQDSSSNRFPSGTPKQNP